jgi:hypothetical protein
MAGSLVKLEEGSPARWAAVLAALMGVAMFGYGVSTFFEAARPPAPFSTALVVVGALDVGLSWLLVRGSRAAWAFATSLNGTAFIVFLFGSFKIRDSGVAMWLAFVPALVFGAITTLLAVSKTR